MELANNEITNHILNICWNLNIKEKKLELLELKYNWSENLTGQNED